MAYTLGGKPSKGTPKDKRIKPNKPFGGKRATPFGSKKGK